MMNAQNLHRLVLICAIMPLFSYLGVLFQGWDLSFYNNLNTTQAVLWGMAVLSAIVLIIYPQNNIPTPPAPVLWGIVALIISVVVLPTLDYPVASILGLPISNMGILHNLAGLIIAYTVYMTCKNNTKNHGIIIGATVIAFALFLTLGMVSEKPAPNGAIRNIYALWFDVYALMALPCLVIILSGFYHAKKWVHYCSTIGIILIAFAIYRSDNISSQALVLIAPIFWVGLIGIDKIFPKHALCIKSALLPVSILFVTVFITLLIHVIDYSDGLGKLDKLRTLFDRSLLFNTYLIAIQNDPIAFFTGFGWGASRELQQLYEPLLYSLYDAQKITFNAGDHRNIISGGLGASSIHNIFLDLLMGIGVFGAMAFLVSLYYLGRACHSHNLVLVAWIILLGLYAVWFPTANSIAPLFIAMGITCALPSIHNTTEPNCPVAEKFMPFAKPVLSISAIIVAMGAFYFIKQATLLSNSYKQQSIAQDLYKDSIYNQDKSNYITSQFFFRNAIAQGLNKMIQGEQIQSQEALIIVQGVDLYKKKSDDGNTIMALELLNVLNIIMTQGADKDMAPARKRYFADWEPALKTAVQRAKYRFDLWKPYFEFMANLGQWQAMGNMAQWILENGNPNDPTAYFFRGIAYQQLGDVATGNADINTALSHGITAIIFNAPDYIKK